ncbi:hypothetical protein QMO17_31470, partial [Klebsiella pneumoniae]|nr:hypothetical protein [Klebsiella pneumoniae]
PRGGFLVACIISRIKYLPRLSGKVPALKLLMLHAASSGLCSARICLPQFTNLSKSIATAEAQILT